MDDANNSAYMATDPPARAPSGPAAYAVEMRGITKRFGRTTALNQMSFRVAKGSLHALLGENGAGKSTLVKILNGIYPAGSYEGQVLLNGTPVQFHAPHDAQGKGVGYVPQEVALLEDLSVAENIVVGHWAPRGHAVIHWPRLHARAAAILERLQVRLDPGVQVASLNAGSRQLVMIARAMVMNPAVLVLDEPTSCLNKNETEALSACLRGLRAQGVTIIFISHRLAEVLDLADAATVLRDGAQAAHFNRAAFDAEKIVTAMVGRRMDSFYPARASAVLEGPPALRVENLIVPHPQVRNRNVVEGLGFCVRRGEILGLYGLLGSGCHEVLCALYGLMPHAGRIWIAGAEVAATSPRRAKSHGIGLVTDDRMKHGLLFNFGIRENVTLHDLQAVSSCGLLRDKLETRHALAFQERLAIRAASVQTPVRNLSGGNQQKVLLAKALFPKPQVLLMDEPTKGVDVGAKREIYAMMTGLVREGLALVLVASELPELLALCDRVIVLARGRIADQFSRAEANEQRLMLAATGATATLNGQ